MNTKIISCTALATLLFVACQSPEQKVVSERKEAAKEISDAQKNELKTEQKAANDVAAAKTLKDQEDAKVKATKEIADAKKKVEDEKVEGTKEVTKAEVNAGQGGTFQKE